MAGGLQMGVLGAMGEQPTRVAARVRFQLAAFCKHAFAVFSDSLALPCSVRKWASVSTSTNWLPRASSLPAIISTWLCAGVWRRGRWVKASTTPVDAQRRGVATSGAHKHTSDSDDPDALLDTYAADGQRLDGEQSHARNASHGSSVHGQARRRGVAAQQQRGATPGEHVWVDDFPENMPHTTDEWGNVEEANLEGGRRRGAWRG